MRRSSLMSNVKSLRDEQERVQKKTFTNWINTYLISCKPPCKITDLFTEIKDGIKLLQLLEVLSSEKLPKESRSNMQRVHCLSNIRTALSFLESKDIKLVNINAADIVDGKPTIVLGLMWTIILYFQIEEQEDMIRKSLEGTELAERGELFKGSAKKALLAWAQNNLGDKYDIDLRDFGGSWRDGAAFNAMVHNIDPSLVDMNSLRGRSNRENLEAAFQAAESGLNIPRLLDAEDVDVDKPDEKSIMTYIAQFLKAYPEGGKNRPKLEDQTDAPVAKLDAARQASDKERLDLESIVNFCRKVESEAPNGDYETLKELQAERNSLQPLVEDLAKRRQEGRLLATPPGDADSALAAWRQAEAQLRELNWRLDSQLPGDLGRIGQWLARAEACLYGDWPADDAPDDEAARLLSERLLEHNDVFSTDPQSVRRDLQAASRQPPAGVSGAQVAGMDARLNNVITDEPDIRRRLEYLEPKHRLLANLAQCERKLPLWTGKYGKQQEAEDQLADYNAFVVDGKLVDGVEQALEALRQQAEPMRKRDPNAAREADRFLADTRKRWDRVKRDVQGAGGPLEKAIGAWKTYTGLSNDLDDWLPGAEQALRSSPEERDRYFADMPKRESDMRQLNDAANQLIGCCVEPVAAEIRTQLQTLSRRWKALFDDFKKTEKLDSLERNRRDYHDGTGRLTDWLDRSEALADAEVVCNREKVKESLDQIQEVADQQEAMENEFKTLSKAAQDMARELPKSSLDDMLNSLKEVRERLQKVRRSLPEKGRGLRGILPQIETMESGLDELANWTEFGESLVADLSGELDPVSLPEKTDAYKNHFSQAPAFKTSLDNKTRALAKIKASRVKGLNMADVEQQLSDLNQRFKDLTGSTKTWDKRLEQWAKLWPAYVQSKEALRDWLERASQVMKNEDADPDELLAEHKQFFEPLLKPTTAGRQQQQQQQLPLAALSKSAKDLAASMENEATKAKIEAEAQSLEAECNDLLAEAPKRQLRLTCRDLEDRLSRRLNEAGDTLQLHKERFDACEPLNDILKDHEDYFYDGDFKPFCSQAAKDLMTSSEALSQLCPEEGAGLVDRAEELSDRLEALLTMAEALQNKLKNLPEKWNNFGEKLKDINSFTKEARNLLEKLNNGEELTAEEYKAALDRLQQLAKEIKEQQSNAEDARALFDELAPNSDPGDVEESRRDMDEALDALAALVPEIGDTLQRAPVMARALDYRESVDSKQRLLDEVDGQLDSRVPLDDKEDARRQLSELRDLRARLLDAEKAAVAANLSEGDRLSRERHCPAFVAEKRADLDEKWRAANSAADERLRKLESALGNWTGFLDCRDGVDRLLDEADAIADRSGHPPGGSDAIRGDIEAKERLLRRLSAGESQLEELRRLAEQLKADASPEKAAELDAIVQEAEARLADASAKVFSQVGDLRDKDRQWRQLYDDLDGFEASMKEREALMDRAADRSLNPEERNALAQDLADSVRAAMEQLEKLEAGGRDLIDSAEANDETDRVKARLEKLRRRLDELQIGSEEQAKEAAQGLEEFEAMSLNADKLSAFLQTAEEYLATPLPKLTNLEELETLCDEHSDFLAEKEKQTDSVKELDQLAQAFRDNPELRRKHKEIKDRWDTVGSDADRRSAKLRAMKDAWHDYDEEKHQFQEKLKELEEMYDEDPERLQEKLEAVQALKLQLAEHEDKLESLSRRLNGLRPDLTDAGARELQENQDALEKRVREMADQLERRRHSLDELVAERVKTVADAEGLRQWAERCLSRHERWAEVQASQVPEVLAHLRAIDAEVEAKRPEAEQLGRLVAEYLEKSPTDADEIHSAFNEAEGRYSRLSDLTKNRVQLCEEWLRLESLQADTTKELRRIETQLGAFGVSEAEIEELQKQLESCKAAVTDFNGQSQQLDDLMERAEMRILQRGGDGKEESLSFADLLAKALQGVEQAEVALQEKRQLAQEAAQAMEDMREVEEQLLAYLKGFCAQLSELEFDPPSRAGVNKILLKLDLMEEEFKTHQDDLTELKAIAKELAAKDASKSASAQDVLSRTQDAWRESEDLLAEKYRLAKALQDSTQAYEEKRKTVQDLLEKLDELRNRDMSSASPEEVRKWLDEIRQAEQELAAAQKDLDAMQQRAGQICRDAKDFAGFDQQRLLSEADGLADESRQLADELREKRKQLEQQAALWDDVADQEEELNAWLEASQRRLDEAADGLADTAAAKDRLARYRDEKAEFQAKRDALADLIDRLEAMNGGKPIESLRELLAGMDARLAEMDASAEELASRVEEFESARDGLEDELREADERARRLKEAVRDCDNQGGSEEELAERLKRLRQQVRPEVEEAASTADSLLSRAEELAEKFATPASKRLQHEAQTVAKRTSSLGDLADATEERLRRGLESRSAERQRDFDAWLATAGEAAEWTPAADRTAVEAQLKILQEALDSLADGEAKLNGLRASTDLLLELFAPDGGEDSGIGKARDESEAKFQTLADTLAGEKDRLQQLKDQLEELAAEEGGLRGWLSDAEDELKSAQALAATPEDKEKQAERLRALQTEAADRQADLEALMDKARSVSDATGDTRPLNTVTEFQERFKKLSQSVSESMEEAEARAEEHRVFLERLAAANQWLEAATESLDEVAAMPDGDRDGLQMKLGQLKAAIDGKDEGSALVMQAQQEAEKVLPKSDPSGRETVRRDTADLRQRFDEWSERGAELERRLEAALMQWSDYDDNYQQLVRWLKEVEYTVTSDLQLKANLPDKRSQLQFYRSRLHDISSHEPILGVVTERGQQLSAPSVLAKLNQLRNRFNDAQGAAKKNVKLCEDMVEQHQAYQDAFQMASDWLHAANEKVAHCDDGQSDRAALEAKIDRISTLAAGLQDGEAKVTQALKEGEKTLQQTAESGQEIIKKEMDWLDRGLEEAKTKCEEMRSDFEKQVADLDAFEAHYDELFQLVKDKEADLKEASGPQASAKDKRDQLAGLEQLAAELADKAPEFDSLLAESHRLQDARLSQQGSQLSSRFNNLRAAVEDAVAAVKRQAAEHEAFDSAVEQLVSALDSLATRCDEAYREDETTPDSLPAVQTALAGLQEELLDAQPELAKVMEQAERLFAATTPDGREAIQEDTGHLRKLSDQVSEQLADSQAKVESQLQETALFKSTLGQLRQWLTGLQDRLEGPLSTERQTLPDRRSQLQSHRAFQQELAGGDHRLEQLRSRLPRRCSEQEQADTDQAADDFAELQERSRELLQRRDAALRALQQVEEAREAAATQLAGAKEKLTAATDGGSDRAAAQLRVEKLREVLESLPEVEEAAADFAKATDEAAGLVGEDQAAQLRAEASALEEELAALATDAEARLQDAQVEADQLADLERSVDELTRLLRTADSQSREREQQPSAPDKRRLADRMSELLAGLEELEALSDRLNGIAAPVQGRDPRLDQAVAQANARLPALRAHLTESADRWNRLADEHEALDKQLEEFADFLANAESDASDIGRHPAGTKDEVEAKLRDIAELRSRLLSRGDELRSLCEAAETVMSGTAPTGREQIKSQVKGFKEDSDALNASLEDEEQRLQAYLGQLVSFTDAKETLLEWLDAAEARLADADAEAEAADTLEAKKRRAGELRALLQEIQSQHRPLELALDKAQSLQAAAAATASSDIVVGSSGVGGAADLNGFIQEASRRYDALKSQAKEMLSRAEEEAADLQQAETGLQSAADWVASMRDRLTPALAAPAGERPRLASRLERLQELESQRDDGERRLQACSDAVRKATADGAPESLRQRLRTELEAVEAGFREYCRDCETARADVEDRLERLHKAESLESTLESWLVEQERAVREAATPRATLDEKSAQLTGLQAVCESAANREADFAQLEAALEDLEANGSQSALNLLAKYQALRANSQQAAERCQAAIEEQRRLQERLSAAEGEVGELESEAANLETTCSVAELSERRRKVEALLTERKPTLQASLQELGAASAAAAASAGVGMAGHDQLRRETRRVKSDFDAVCERLVTLRRALEQRAAQADDLEAQLSRLSNWIADARGRLEASAQPQDSLEARKQQLQACRTLSSELHSVAKQPAALNEQLASLATSGHVDVGPMNKHLDELAASLDGLAGEVKAQLAECEESVRELAAYREARDEATDWVASLAERVEFCADFTGDRNTLEGRLERLKELAGGHREAESRLSRLDELAGAARSRSTPDGAAGIEAEVAGLRQSWSQLASRAESLQSELRSRADAWADYEAVYQRCAGHAKAAESELKEAQDPRTTLEEKLALAERLSEAARALEKADTVGADFSDLTQRAAALASASRGESHVTGQASQLANRRAGLLEQLREAASRAETQAAQHRAFDAEVASFSDWLDAYEARLAECQKAEDRGAAQAALKTASQLLTEREEGFRRAQVVQDRLQPALAATAAPGRERLRSAAHAVQARWDACATSLGSTRHRLEAILAQWTLYEEGAGQVERWSRELQEQLERDDQEAAAAAAAPLADQWARLERLRGHQMAARSRQPAARSFAEKASALSPGARESPENGEVADEAIAGVAARRLHELADEYDRLAGQLDERLREGERQMREARAFREALAEAQDWLTLAAERLGPTEAAATKSASSPTSENAAATDRSSLESGLASVRALLDQAPVGEQRLVRAEERAETAPAPAAARQETARLRAAFDDLLVRCRAEAIRLQKAVDGWSAYDATYAGLKDWLAATEKRLQPEQLGASLEEKQKLAEAQDRLSEEVAGKLNEFRSLAQQSTQLLGEGGADLKVSTQLAKLLARYHGLSALARDHAQKLRGHADDHAEFERNAGEAERWIAEARERLASARREPDDRFGLQRQRERLAELAMKREEGQVLAEAAAHWADKAERNTALVGREELRAQAQRVQAAWDSLVKELLETRAASEQRLQKWTELDDTVDKVARWIKEREERLLTLNEPQQAKQQDSAISALQRLRELHQEVAAYEPVVQAAAERCRAMGRQEAADQLPASYDDLRHNVQARLSEAEATAERRREFQQALQEQRAWLQRSRTALSALQQEAKAAGDLAAVRHNLAQASALLSDAQGEAATARMTRLLQLAAAAEATPEALECQEKAAAMRAQAAETCGSLERLAEQLEAFQTAHDSLEAWLKDQLPAALSQQQQHQKALGDTAEEKRRLAEQSLQRESQLRERQSEAEALAQRARSLAELGADPRATSGAASQLAGRVRAALEKSADQGRAALEAAKRHGELDSALGDLDQWLADCRERLNAAASAESPEQTERRLAELQTELESGRARLRGASELADQVLPATGASGVEQLRAALQRARREHESIQMAVGEARANAEAVSSARRDFQRQADQLAGWLADAEAKLSTSEEAVASGGPAQQGLTERRAALERARVLQREAASQEAVLRRLQERAGAAGGDSRDRANAMARRHEELTAGLAQLADRLASSVTGQQEFQEASERAAAWLAQARTRLAQAAGAPTDSSAAAPASSAAPSRGDLDARAEQLANLRSDAGRAGQPLMDRLTATAAALSKARAPNAAEAADEADRLTDNFRALLAETEAAETRLLEASKLWRGFQEGWQRLADWIKDAEQRLRRGNEPAPNLDAKRRQAREFQVMSDEIHAKRPDLDKLQSLGASLEQLTGAAQAAARVAQLAAKYQALMTQCSEANQRLHQISSDIKAYEEAHDSARQWIDQATQRLLNSSGYHGDAGKLAEKRRAVREISDSMYEGENRLANVMEAGDRVLRTCDNPDAVRRQMDEMRADWSQLSKQLQQVLTGLDKAASKLGEFSDLSGRLSGWLGDSERTLSQLTGGQRFSETPEKREQYDRFKSLKSEVDRTEGDFDELQQLCDELQAIGKQPDLERQCKDLRYRYNQLKRAVGLKVEELARAQQEQQAYQDGLQECEKWILQASFRLMEQSSAQAPSLEDAQRASDAHAVVCREIDEQRKALDSVVRMGKKLAEDNSGNAELRQEIEGQLKTLEENFANLKETAENTKNNLKENLAKWKSYRDLLQATDRWLHSDLAAWWAGRDPAVTKSAEDAERQTQETRAMQTRLSQARADVSAAGFKCEPRGGVSSGVGAAESSDGFPTRGPAASAVPSAAATAAAMSMSRLADKVSRDLDANLERVERRLSQLETQRDAWERVSAEADDLSDWLRDREAEAGALADIFAIERLRDEVAAKSISHELAEAKPQLKAARDSLLRRLDGIAAQKRQAEALEEERKQRQMAKELEMEELRLRVSRARLAAAAPAGESTDDGSPHWDRQTQTPCHQGTQTAKKQQAASALDLTDSSLFDRPVRDIQLRNSGGGSGISRRMWPYHSAWDTSYKEDPIESLRRTLADMEARGISSAQPVRQPTLRPQSAASPYSPPPLASARASTPVGLTRSDAFNDVLASARGESVRRSGPSPTMSLSAASGAGGGAKRAASAPRRNFNGAGSATSRRDRSASPAVVATGGGSGFVINGDAAAADYEAADANRRLPKPSTKQLTKQFVRDYEQLLVEPGNHKQPSPRVSMDRAERASSSMRDAATKLRNS